MKQLDEPAKLRVKEIFNELKLSRLREEVAEARRRERVPAPSKSDLRRATKAITWSNTPAKDYPVKYPVREWSGEVRQIKTFALAARGCYPYCELCHRDVAQNFGNLNKAKRQCAEHLAIYHPELLAAPEEHDMPQLVGYDA